MGILHIIGKNARQRNIGYKCNITSEKELLDEYIIPFEIGETIYLSNKDIKKANGDTLQIFDSELHMIDKQSNSHFKFSHLSSSEEDIKYIAQLGVSGNLGEEVTKKILQKAQRTIQSHRYGESSPHRQVTGVKKDVFIVHGHDAATKLEVEDFVKRIGLSPIILHKQANEGQTIIEKLEKHLNQAGYAIVIYTKCDEGRILGADTDSLPRARQNVVLEHGWAIGALGRKKVCALVEKGVEIPGDMNGVLYVPLEGDWQLQVAKEMKKAKLPVDLNRLIETEE